VREWQEIATALLKKYADRYYKYEKSAYEQKFLELRDLAEDDPNFIAEYRLLIEESAADIAEKLGELKALIESKKIQDWNFQSLHAIGFGQHLVLPAVTLHQQCD
jgi:CHASE3 domain sensor protein